MHLVGVGTASPPARYTKAECQVMLSNSFAFGGTNAALVLRRGNRGLQ